MKLRIEIEETTHAVAVIDIGDEEYEEGVSGTDFLDSLVADRDIEDDEDYEVNYRDITVIGVVADDE